MICEYDAWTWGEVVVRYEVCPVGYRVWARRIYLHSVLFALLGAFLLYPQLYACGGYGYGWYSLHRGGMRCGHFPTRENGGRSTAFERSRILTLQKTRRASLGDFFDRPSLGRNNAFIWEVFRVAGPHENISWFSPYYCKFSSILQVLLDIASSWGIVGCSS